MLKCNLELDRRSRERSFLLLSNSTGMRDPVSHGEMRWFGLNRTFRRESMWAIRVVDHGEVLMLVWKYQERDLFGQRNELGK